MIQFLSYHGTLDLSSALVISSDLTFDPTSNMHCIRFGQRECTGLAWHQMKKRTVAINWISMVRRR